MKSIWNTGLKGGALFLIGALAPAWAQAQACDNKYFNLKEGVRLEYTLYSGKNKLEGTQWQEITSVESTPDGLRAEMRVGMKDAKGKDTFESNYGYLCQGNTVKIDFNSLMAGPMQEQFPDAEAEITGVDVECILGRYAGPGHYAHGWHNTGTLGTFGAAAAAARSTAA